ncbi:hypothetical protein, partial [Winogradskyella flava]|nr:hypothetical protein [Winogradskyella flava]
MKISTRFSKCKLSFFFLFFSFTCFLSAQNAVDSWTITTQSATDSDSYIAGGQNHQYGQGDEVTISSVTWNGSVFTIPFASQFYLFRRDDIASNAQGVAVLGDKASIFYERTGASNFIFGPGLPGTPGAIDLETILKEPIINRGALDVFRNQGTNGAGEGPSNIERIDVVFPSLRVDNTGDLDLNGFLASEKNGNNTFKAAAILSIDGAGNPTSFGNLVTINNAAYGEPTVDSFNPARAYSFMEDTNSDNQPVRVGGNSERMGLSIITFNDLGIGAGQTFYGIAFFGDDVFDSDDLLDPTSFPDDTTTGADIHGALGSLVTATGFDPADDDGDGVSNSNDICANGDDNINNDGDAYPDACDADDDNDGILDINELNCSPGFVTLGQTFNDNSSDPVIVNNIYAYGGVNVDATFDLRGSATWNGGVEDDTAVGVAGSYINTQPNNTDFPNGDVAVYTYTFSQPVYNVNFKFGGLDFEDRADFVASNGVQNVPVSISDINLGADLTITGQSAVSSASGANAPANSIAVEIVGPVTQIEITVGKNLSDSNNVTMQFYELSYCVPLDTDSDGVYDIFDLDSDNDGIYDVDEAGNGALDTNNDGVVDANDTGFADTDMNGADDTAEVVTPVDSDPANNDGPDFQDTDSDGDGCTDANEAYGNESADGGDGGQFGVDPAASNPTNGLVTEAGVNYALGTNTNVTDALIDLACTSNDDDGDGNPNGTDPNPNTPTASDDSGFALLDTPNSIDILFNDDYLDNLDGNNLGTTTITDTGAGTAGGTITFDADAGTLIYTPLDSEAGTTVTVVYEVCNDSNGPLVCSTATVTIVIEDDLDNDGIGDSADDDNDNDGITDANECAAAIIPPFNISSGASTSFNMESSIGMILDISSIDNNFNIEINGTLLAPQDIEFSRNASTFVVGDSFPIFASDNNGYGQGGIGGVWTLNFNNANPSFLQMRLIISETGAVTLLAKRDNDPSTELEEMIVDPTTPQFNTITWNTSGNNTIVVSQLNTSPPTFLYASASGCPDSDGDGVSDNLDLDADNDGIYDVDEAGNGALDTNNDGVVDSNDTGFSDLDNNGADDDAELVTPVDSDPANNDGPDFQDTDSDGDGCPDANEAYSYATAAGSDNGQFGEPDPASVNATNGLVTETGVNYLYGTNAAVTDPNISICGPDPCDALTSGNLDTDNDGITDYCDSDDDNDGILDIRDLDCASGPLALGQTFADNTGSNFNTEFITNIYEYGGASATFEYEPFGGSAWAGAGITNQNNPAILPDGEYINTIADGTTFPGNDFVRYAFTFSEPVYNVNFKIGGLDDFERVDLTAANGTENVPVNMSDINVGAGLILGGQTAITGASATANAPSNSINIEVFGPVTQIVIIAGKENGDELATVNLQFYEMQYCVALDTDNDGVNDIVDLDSDNDGIYDVDEAGGQDVDNDGMADGAVDPSTGIPASAGTGLDPIDTLNDMTFDYQNTDSDGDGCPDANEAYGNVNAAGADGGQFGFPDPPNVDASGLVDLFRLVNYDLGTNTAVTDPLITTACEPCDAMASGNTDSDGDNVSDICDVDDDNDGILDVDEQDCSSGPLALGQTFADNTGSNFNGESIPNVYNYGGASVTFGYEPFGGSAWAGTGITSENNPAIMPDGEYINTIADGTTFPEGEVVRYSFTFSQPVYNVNFKIGGLDDFERVELTAANGTENVPVNISDINVGVGLTLGGQTAITGASATANAPSNSINIEVLGPVTEVVIFAGKQDGNELGTVNLQFYEMQYCVAIDTDFDGIIDSLDVDSDNDGCPDAVEASGDFVQNDLTTDNNLADADEGVVDGNGLPIEDTNGVDISSNVPQLTSGAVTVSETITLTSISTNPGTVVCAGEDVAFTANASGIRVTDFGTTGGTGDDTTENLLASELLYQWYISTDNGATFTAIGGETNATLNVNNIAAATPAVQYRVEVTSANNSCPEELTETITVNDLPTVEAGTYAALCEDATAITLTGTPTDANGTWSGTGVTDNGDGTASFDPSGLSGAQTVTYSYTDGN